MNLNFTRTIVFLVTVLTGINYKSYSQVQNSKPIPVYASMEKGDSTWIAVEDLFHELRKSVNTSFQPVPANAFKGQGIFIGTTRLAKKLNIAVPAKLLTYGPEGIYIKGTENSVLIIGNTQYALQEAVFIYLEKLGFRYLLPGELWEEIPGLRTVYKKTEVLTEPDFDNRTIGNGHGYANSKKIESEFKAWEKANRMGGAFPVRNGHSYDQIVLDNAAFFRQHPEYFAQTVAKGSLPEGPKFNVANKDLVEFIAKNAVKRLDDFKKTGQHTLMVSMEPSDGGGFCTTAACKAIGTPSDQAYYLANRAAREVRKKYPDSWVGLYAYNEHILPTRFDLEPNVFVMITNGFNRSRYSTEELLGLWGKKTKKTGVYEYLHVYEGSMDMPGQMHIGNTKYLARSIKSFYKAGATTYVGESTMGWVSKAIGNYTLARLLWDVDADIEQIK
ncbi:MAG TPA: DUF4838 domain-containing protein, partial [Chitinophagaceae bacterium]|nr:DUF4838 domain-containing protein [Chitinophagaceae bacterium]